MAKSQKIPAQKLRRDYITKKTKKIIVLVIIYIIYMCMPAKGQAITLLCRCEAKERAARLSRHR